MKYTLLTEGPEYEATMRAGREADTARQVWDELWPQLRAQYPGQLVARAGRKIVAAHEDPERLCELLNELGLRPAVDVDIEYIDDGRHKFVL